MAQLTFTTTAASPKLKSATASSPASEKVPDSEVNNNHVEVIPVDPDPNIGISVNAGINSQSQKQNGLLASSEAVTGMYLNDSTQPEIPLIDQAFPTVIVWKNVFLFIYLHSAAIYGAYLFVSGQVYLLSFIWGVPFYTMNGLGITAGCHRLWCHKSYKARLPLRILLTFFQTVACQNSIYEWCQDHRVHHKYSETNADPHNSKRGFFFAHMGWLMCRKHPAVKEYGKKIDMSDLANDPIVAWQKKYYIPLVIMVAFILPTFIPVYCWNESWAASWFFTVTFRYCVMLHFTWMVNSVAHLYGNQPYDKNINPRENKLVGILALGEGWHNYHHTFPWDYKTSELGFYRFNLTTAFLDLMAKIGWAYDLKTVPKHVVADRIRRTGDGTHLSQQPQDGHEVAHTIEVHDETASVLAFANHDHHHENATWGWGDKDISEKDVQITERLFRLEASDKRDFSNDWKKER